MPMLPCLKVKKNIQRIQHSVREVQAKMEDEMRAKAVAQDNLFSADRGANANKYSLEEARTLLEQSDWTRRMLKQELADTNKILSDLTCQNQVIFILPGLSCTIMDYHQGMYKEPVIQTPLVFTLLLLNQI